MTKRTLTTIGALALTLLLAAPALAQPGRGMGRGRGMGPGGGMGPRLGSGGGRMLAQHLYSPRLVMRFADDLKLTTGQRNTLKKELKRVSSETTDIQFAMQTEAAKLGKLLASSKVSEKSALAQSDKVMNMERKLKRLHLRLLIKVKNLLTATQKSKLDEIKAQWRKRMGTWGGRGGWGRGGRGGRGMGGGSGMGGGLGGPGAPMGQDLL